MPKIFLLLVLDMENRTGKKGAELIETVVRLCNRSVWDLLLFYYPFFLQAGWVNVIPMQECSWQQGLSLHRHVVVAGIYIGKVLDSHTRSPSIV